MGWIQKQQKFHILETIGADCPTMSAKDNSILDRKHPFARTGILDEDRPFIPAEMVSSKSKQGRLAVKGQTAADPSRQDWWIVIDNIVYDCTDFILEHPGGEQVIMSFIGEDCSWQFRRFHSRKIVEEDARPLRIGRTDGVKNRFKEPKRFLGLSTSGGDEW